MKRHSTGTASDRQRAAKFNNVPHIFGAPGNSYFLPISSTKRGPLHFIESAPKAPRETGALGARAPKVRPLSAQKAPEMSAPGRTQQPCSAPDQTAHWIAILTADRRPVVPDWSWGTSAVGLKPCTLQICESSAKACCSLLADLGKWPREPRAA